MSVCNTIIESLDIDTLCNAFENSIQPIAITDSNWEDGIKFIFVNRAFCLETGYLKEELIGKSPKMLQGEDSNYKILKELKKDLIDEKSFFGQSVNYRKDKSSYFVQWSISILKNKNNKVIGYISFQKTIDRKLSFSNEKLLSSIVENSNNLILATDLNGVIVYTNEAFNKTFGYLSDELIGKHTRILKSGMQDEIFYKNMWRSLIKKGSFVGVFESIKKDGTLFYDKKNISTIKDQNGSSLYYVSISQDISKQLETEKELKKEIYIDTLTKVFNRKKYDEIILNMIKLHKSNKKSFSLVLIDIDYFKSINDNYGHDMGDYILQEFAKIIQETIGEERDLFRWGGEEFAILIDSNLEDTLEICENLQKKIRSHRFQSINLTASFAIGVFQRNDTEKTLFKKVDKALYVAKNSGRDKRVIGE